MSTTPFGRSVDAATAGVNRVLGPPSWQRGVMRMVQPQFGQGMSDLRGMPSGQAQKFRGNFQVPIESRFGDTTRSIANRFPQFYGPMDATSDAQDKLLQQMPGMQSGYNTNPTGDAAIDQAAAAKGVPPAVLAAMVNRESSGDWAANNRIGDVGRKKPDGTTDYILPYVGIFQTTAQSWNLDWNAMVGNQQAQLEAMATILSGIYQQQGFSSWTDTAAYYFAGPNWNNPGWGDELGMTVGQYRDSFDADVASYGGGNGYDPTGNSVLNIAMSYVGTPYVWGGIPGKGADPRATGWDCSGMTYWMDQNYGNGQLPAGSHYQYQYAQNTGQLFMDTSQLQAGDLVFFDTGDRSGGGGNLNGASHVAVYLGNGKMLHAANPDQGTIISDFTNYAPQNGYTYLGAMHMGWSGGGGYTGGSQQQSATSGDPRYGSAGNYLRSYYYGWRPS